MTDSVEHATPTHGDATAADLNLWWWSMGRNQALREWLASGGQHRPEPVDLMQPAVATNWALFIREGLASPLGSPAQQDPT